MSICNIQFPIFVLTKIKAGSSLLIVADTVQRKSKHTKQQEEKVEKQNFSRATNRDQI